MSEQHEDILIIFCGIVFLACTKCTSTYVLLPNKKFQMLFEQNITSNVTRNPESIHITKNKL